MNYSSDVNDNIYKFLWFIKKSYKNVTSQQKQWLKEIKEIHKIHTSRVS